MKFVIDRAIPFIEGVFEPYGAEVVYKEGPEIVRADLLDADALVIRTRTRCDAALLEGTPVKLIATATASMDNIDQAWCKEHGVTNDDLVRRGWDVGVTWHDGRLFECPWCVRLNIALPFSQIVDAFDRMDRYVFV
jgi:hypothetical protein